MKKYHTTHQYEPIQVPARFGDEMQRFVNRLTEIYDDIYRRYGRLGLNDISTAFGDALDVIRDRISQTESSVTAVSKKANSAWEAANVNSRDILELQKRPSGGVSDHGSLTGRNAPNQHTISSVAGLQNELDGKQDEIDDLDAIRNGASLGESALQEPVSEGTSGQFLQTDGAGGRVWATPQGGGGTSDYNDLTNKPKIEGVTLTGNRTLVQLLGGVLKRQSYQPSSSQSLAGNGTYTVTFTPGAGYEPVCWWYEGTSPNTNLVVSCVHKYVEGSTDEWQIRIYNHGSASTTIQGTTYCVFIKKVEPQVMLMMGAGRGAQPHGEIENENVGE